MPQPVVAALLDAAVECRVTGDTTPERAVEVLKQVWGAEWETRLDQVTQFAAQYPALVRFADETGYGNDPHVIIAVWKAIQGQEQLDAEIKEAMRDPAYLTGHGREHKRAVERVRRLFEKKYGSA